MATIIIFDRPYGTLCAFEMATPPSDHIIIGLDSSGERATRKVSNHSHVNSQQSSLWAPMATKIIFDRPYGTLCAFEMATPPSDHIIIGLDSSGERATRKVSNHSHFTLCGGGLSSLVRVIMMSWG